MWRSRLDSNIGVITTPFNSYSYLNVTLSHQFLGYRGGRYLDDQIGKDSLGDTAPAIRLGPLRQPDRRSDKTHRETYGRDAHYFGTLGRLKVGELAGMSGPAPAPGTPSGPEPLSGRNPQSFSTTLPCKSL